MYQLKVAGTYLVLAAAHLLAYCLTRCCPKTAASARCTSPCYTSVFYHHRCLHRIWQYSGVSVVLAQTVVWTLGRRDIRRMKVDSVCWGRDLVALCCKIVPDVLVTLCLPDSISSPSLPFVCTKCFWALFSIILGMNGDTYLFLTISTWRHYCTVWWETTLSVWYVYETMLVSMLI